MRRYLWLLVGLATLAGLPSHAIAQSGGTVAGTVVDASSLRPLAGVQIFVVGTQRGSLSDQQGRFSISGVPAGTQQIRA
ncbi:MAG TPA: carboxypeptidase-like regulatory domain-containing protein, partial [Longimicrobiaceae bacterium]